MPLIRPFAALRPAPEHTDNVLAPPYDVVNTEEARERAVGKPWSFLHISRPEIDLEPGVDQYSEAVYAKGAENLQNMREQGILIQDEKPSYYIYRLTMGERSQTGFAAVASVAAYDENRVRKHEFTRPDKENDRVRNIETLSAQTGPVMLACHHNETLAAIVQDFIQTPPVANSVADTGVRHELWVVDETAIVDKITATFDDMPAIYIADGHHRSAAASRVAAARAAEHPNQTGEEPWNYFLVVIFPDSEMEILDYNRVVKDLNGLSNEAFLQKIAESFDVEPSSTPFKPAIPGEFGMYLDKQWYKLSLHEDKHHPGNPVKDLDISLLADNLIEPILGISDPRKDKRIDFVGGIRGLAGLEARVDSGDMQVAFALYPTSMAQLMAVAEAGEVMPPKSTWFEPKLADGLVSHLI